MRGSGLPSTRNRRRKVHAPGTFEPRAEAVSPPRLILFDIDGTLVLTGGAGARAMARAFEDVFGVPAALAGFGFAGRTDAWILHEIASRHGIPLDEAAVSRFFEVYIDHLVTEVEQPGPRKGTMPGVRPLLDALSARQDAWLGLLTGNVEDGARVKLEHFGLWRYFRCGAFGGTDRDRRALFAAALSRVAACGGPPVSARDVVIVGDTPHDVAVARAGGGRAVAVATGSYGVEALRDSGADAVLEDLGDLEASLAAILGQNGDGS